LAEAPENRSLLSLLWERHGEKVRYLVVGACNTGLGYLAFLLALATVGRWMGTFAGSPSALLSALGNKNYLVAQWVSWVFMVPVSTTTFKLFVFRTEGRWLHQVGKAYLVYLPAQGISSLLLWLAVQVLHLVPAVGQLMAIAFATVFSYIGHKYFTFRIPLETGEVPAEELLE
jgi:putative flippase GtrA